MSGEEKAPLLSEAFEEFTKDRDPIFAAPRKSNWQVIVEVARHVWHNSAEVEAEGVWRYSWRIAATHGFRRVKAAIYQWQFLKPFREGLRRAVGHIVPRHEASKFAPIDRAIWHEGAVDLERSWVRAEDVSYAGVRVVDAPEEKPAANGPVAEPAPTDQARAKPGRKSAEAYVRATVDDLWADPAFRNLGRKEQLERVRAVISIDDPAACAAFEKATDKTLRGQIAKRVHELEQARRGV
jgi:hypothetical protein